MVDGFAQLERIRARTRLKERRITKTKRIVVPSSTATPTAETRSHASADTLKGPAHLAQGPIRATGVWGKVPSSEYEGSTVAAQSQLGPVLLDPASGGGSARARSDAKPVAAASPNSSLPRSLELPALPWALGALAPVISSRALQYHFGHHHRQDVEATNRLIRGRPELFNLTLLDIVLWSVQNEPQSPLCQHASQAWNHDFFWSSLSPEKQRPNGALRQAMVRDFGDYERFSRDFVAAGVELFGSGWLWLSVDAEGSLRIRACSNSGSPVSRGERCLLVVDLWEHAYYLDHQDCRREYLDAIIDRRLDWRFAYNNFTHAPRRASQSVVEAKIG